MDTGELLREPKVALHPLREKVYCHQSNVMAMMAGLEKERIE
jgi:hypothetical protein